VVGARVGVRVVVGATILYVILIKGFANKVEIDNL